MKIKRHSKIIELINTYDIETQEELAQRLEESGFVVTQATVSRDIRDLKLSKVVYGDGKQKYSLMPKQDGISEKYVRILKEAFISMDMAQNILVLKTVSGMAMAVAAALDSLQMNEIVGCIAGDDTIMAAIRSVDDTVVVMERIRKLIYKE
ncbi:arginine repressor [Lachnoanaerobaculum saburreum F0468]|jgi:arginine repressor|uniref:Arginine repressor n=2 Tax=Lachnoanaerobaculum saburreum TaxID=467210 RepID=I0R5X2_9FIRM|nr:arginine repressor [Lachnoanaerobaculum saburreum]EFU76097.1 arginine repressor [Lachnoanaerobaculum saburreum DSM 3986]EIC95080.1 arginine repressor [Lachnoanaerobaculum saburreum F0468]RKW53056.1 MAG: arginine repressor [Lachnospiraceae bacterium]